MAALHLCAVVCLSAWPKTCNITEIPLEQVSGTGPPITTLDICASTLEGTVFKINGDEYVVSMAVCGVNMCEGAVK